MRENSAPVAWRGRGARENDSDGRSDVRAARRAVRVLTRSAAATWIGRQGAGQAARFAVVGLSGVVVNIAVLSLLYTVLHWPLLTSVVLAAEVAMASNYIWNECWTFGRRRLTLGRLVAFNASSLVGIAIATVTTLALVRGGLPYVLADLVSVVAGAACTFSLSKFWVWRAVA